MSKQDIEDVNTLEAAIQACADNIKSHRNSSRIAIASAMFLLIGLFLFILNSVNIISGSIDKERINLLKVIDDKNEQLQSFNKNNEFVSTISYYRDQLEQLSKDNSKNAENKKKQINSNIADLESRLNDDIKDIQNNIEKAKNEYDKFSPPPIFPNELMLVMVSLTIIIISVFTAIYRAHIKEATKNEHYLTGFHRIRATINNQKDLKDNVVSALIEGAFTIQSESFFSKKQKLESPLPGHPTSDIATTIVNELIKRIEIVLKNKKE